MLTFLATTCYFTPPRRRVIKTFKWIDTTIRNLFSTKGIECEQQSTGDQRNREEIEKESKILYKLVTGGIARCCLLWIPLGMANVSQYFLPLLLAGWLKGMNGQRIRTRYYRSTNQLIEIFSGGNSCRTELV